MDSKNTAAADQHATTDRVVMVDQTKGLVYTAPPADRSTWIRFAVTGETVIRNDNGRPVSLGSVRPGQMVKITHAGKAAADNVPPPTAFLIQQI